MITLKGVKTMWMVVGYAPTPRRETKWGEIPANWEVYLLSSKDALTRVMWHELKNFCLLEEWL